VREAWSLDFAATLTFLATDQCGRGIFMDTHVTGRIRQRDCTGNMKPSSAAMHLPSLLLGFLHKYDWVA
jgi:hypothetical protein